MASSIDLNINININNSDDEGFTCQTCGKLYSSVQALGGHQNAHRKERFALKRRHIEMKRQLARQMSLLPAPSVGPSNVSWAAPYVINSMVPLPPPEATANDDMAGGVDLTLRL